MRVRMISNLLLVSFSPTTYYSPPLLSSSLIISIISSLVPYPSFSYHLHRRERVPQESIPRAQCHREVDSHAPEAQTLVHSSNKGRPSLYHSITLSLYHSITLSLYHSITLSPLYLSITKDRSCFSNRCLFIQEGCKLVQRDGRLWIAARWTWL